MHQLTEDQILARMGDYLRGNSSGPIPATLSRTTHLVRDLALDSLDGAQMLADLEDHYHVTIAVSALHRAETLGDVAAAVIAAQQAGQRA